MDARHFARAIQQILLEIRTTRQYVQFVHNQVAEFSMHFEGIETIPTPDEVKARARTRKATADAAAAAAKNEVEQILQRRREQGYPDELTPEEEAAFARGETPDSFR